MKLKKLKEKQKEQIKRLIQALSNKKILLIKSIFCSYCFLTLKKYNRICKISYELFLNKYLFMLNKKIIAAFATATILTASLTTNTFADLDEKIISANKNYTITNYATYEQKKSYKRAKKSVLNKIYS